MDKELLEDLAQEGGPDPDAMALLRREVRKATVVIGPPEPFATVAKELLAMGYTVAPCAGTPAQAWCIERSERPFLRTRCHAVPPGREVPLTSLDALETSFGFEPPRLDQAWAGGPIRLAGVPYLHGIGMHAWCRMSFAVPEGAVSFRSLVGIDDSARGCDRALVMVSVLTDDDVGLYESELLDLSTPPLQVAVSVEGRHRLTLVVGEGGNGRDCDHVSWAEPVFVMKAP